MTNSERCQHGHGLDDWCPDCTIEQENSAAVELDTVTRDGDMQPRCTGGIMWLWRGDQQFRISCPCPNHRAENALAAMALPVRPPPNAEVLWLRQRLLNDTISFRPGDPRPESEANARLIAAAPELLDLLHGVLDSQESNGSVGVQLMAEIRAAIAKAQG